MSSPQIIEDGLELSLAEKCRIYKSAEEELEAMSFYEQRVSASQTMDLKDIFNHNAKEEKEHLVMLLEYLRRIDTDLNDAMKEILFSEGKIEGDH